MSKLFSRVVISAWLGIAFIFTGKVLASGPADGMDSVRTYHWLSLDPQDDQVAGISLHKAYQLLEGRPATPVRVAIIDSGFDIDHIDLKGKYWVNEDEIPGNGIDDDDNGYIDDVNGWNFIGGDSANVIYDTYELTREYKRLKEKYGDRENGKGKEYEYWISIRDEFEEVYEEANSSYAQYKNLLDNIPRYYHLLEHYLGTDSLTVEQILQINSQDSVIQEASMLIGKLMGYFGGSASVSDMVNVMGKGLDHYNYEVKYGYNLDFDPRTLVNDDYSNTRERYYGNNQVGDYSGMMGSHGTHVAGIVAAIRDNATGARGVAEQVEIIPLRTVPNGDERDKDVANAIYYAVDNGARVINMSFGKSYSPDRDVVEKAIRYAEKKNVLIVHAAGNDAENKDVKPNFPTRKFIRGSREASNMIEVGASSRYLDVQLPGSFSNYGKNTVDLFAPGVEIFSCIPGDKYKFSNGTSMASPVVAGVAALLWSYFPELEASDIREILIESAYKYEGEVQQPGTREMVPFSELSISGGVVNAYEAVKIAQNMIRLNTR